MTQRDIALDRANIVRFARADIKRQIARGEVSICYVVLNPPTDVNNMPLFDLMMAQRRWGRERVLKFLARNDLSERLGLQTMTARQRNVFVNAITRFTWSPEGCSSQTQ